MRFLIKAIFRKLFSLITSESVLRKSFSQDVYDLMLKILLALVMELTVILSHLSVSCDMNTFFCYIFSVLEKLPSCCVIEAS